MEIEALRKNIDEIDREIVRLLDQRAAAAEAIGRAKARCGLPMSDRRREAQVLLEIQAAGKGHFGRRALTRVYLEIMRESKRLQQAARSSVNANEQSLI